MRSRYFLLSLFLGLTHFTPSLDAATSAIRKIALGQSHTCALWESGEVKCWGNNGLGALGLGDKVSRGNLRDQMGANLPFVSLGTGRRAVDIEVGSGATCVILDDASVKCWGQNNAGQLGQGDIRNRGGAPNEMGDNLKSVNLGKDVLVDKIAMGIQSVCVIAKDKRVKCWGNNQLGQLGLGDRIARGALPTTLGDSLPYVDLGTNAKAKEISLGNFHACALLESGELKCWGQGLAVTGSLPGNNRGDQPNEMGDKLPVLPMPADSKIVSLSARGNHACASFEDGSLRCWGQNQFGQLGVGDMRERGANPAEDLGNNLSPANLAPGLDRLGFSSGAFFSCAWFLSGTAKCWGLNNQGQLGTGDILSRGAQPDQIGDALPFLDLGKFSVVKRIFVGPLSACAVLARPDGGDGVKCWGANNLGQLGLGDVLPRGQLTSTMGDRLPFLDL